LDRLAAFPQVHGAIISVARKKGPQLTLEAFRFIGFEIPQLSIQQFPGCEL
jgi:hypothetical protein